MHASIERLAIVTGGSRGLGAALCDEFEAAGFTVYELSRSGRGPGHVEADMQDPLGCAAAIKGVLCGVDRQSLREVVVVNNASSLQPIGGVSNGGLSEVLSNLQVNIVSAIAVLATVISLLDEVTGRKVLAQVTSGSARSIHSGLALYSAGKAGMEQFMRVLAQEQTLQARGFVTALVDPGAVDTDMQAILRGAAGSSLVASAEWKRRHEAGELASARDIARRMVKALLSADLRQGAHIRIQADEGHPTHGH